MLVVEEGDNGVIMVDLLVLVAVEWEETDHHL
jgi:hypothetical protein